MILSFEGRTMSEIADEVRAFLRGEPPAAEEPAPRVACEVAKPAPVEPPFVADPPKKSQYTVADVRTEMGELAKAGVARDVIREAMKSLCGADRVSEIPEDKYDAIMHWCAEQKGAKNA